MDGHLIPHASLTPAMNMALDQAILDQVSTTASPTLRFYGWDRPTLSLGYFQSHRDVPETLAGLDAVRRSTGGGAIVHHHELTYSIAMPIESSATGARAEFYHAMHRLIANELADRGIKARPYGSDPRLAGDDNALLCFERRTDEDLILCGYKILGSAQRRTKTAVLQHGSLLMRASRHANQLPGLFDLTGTVCSPEDFAIGIGRRVADVFGITWHTGPADSSLLDAAKQIAEQRFENTDWWTKR